MSASKNPNYMKPGLGHVGAYQASSIPFLSSSIDIPAFGEEPVHIEFRRVSKFVIITNTVPGNTKNVPLRFGFSVDGVNGAVENNYGVLNNGESFEADYRVTGVYLISDSADSGCQASVLAGLTPIEASRLPNNWNGEWGVGG